MKLVLSLFCLLALFSTALPHGDNSHFPAQQDVVVKTTKVNGNVYMLQGRGGNVGALVGTDGILIVDDDYREVSEKLAAALKELGSATPRFVLNTHWHSDHTQGNEFFGKTSTIIAHSNVRKRLSEPYTRGGKLIEASPVVAWPIITYTAEMSLFLNGEEVRAVHYPTGHTDGDTVVFFVKSNVIHMGDHYFAGRFPFVDLSSGGSVAGLVNNLNAVLARVGPETKIIPGHGPVSSKADLQSYTDTIVDTVKIVQDAMRAGKSLDEIKKAGFPEKYKDAGSGFIKTDMWIETIYRSYSAK